jgi:hypothetical protein
VSTAPKNPRCQAVLDDPAADDCATFWPAAGGDPFFPDWCKSCAGFYEIIVRPRQAAATRRIELPSGLVAIYSPEGGWLVERPGGTEVQHSIYGPLEMIDTLSEEIAGRNHIAEERLVRFAGVIKALERAEDVEALLEVAVDFGLSLARRVGGDLAAIYDPGPPEDAP